ncbi:helix-turn-helix domain-containing protein [Paenarthrobacter sp. DKR-5]|uniref:helix-turn-helix domain-containing protein n=1 Tax=Paenarthrobacter sp. DKR-5 TaxID=2835535 RepID=UPI001BDC80CB|nr:helix-turn-helix domain-containing protein [Paenarthrobacter sp. DKR-5]MBT1001180.1 helix-turn-helix domain-containing protein [Paenarthrobacter sp. DKR-5]
MVVSHPWGNLLEAGRFEWEKVVRQCRFPKQNTKLVALTIATYADTKTGQNIYPGQKRLAAHTGISDRAVRDHLKDLERFGLLYLQVKGSSFGRGGKGMASRYQLSVPQALFDWFHQEAQNDLDVWDLDGLDYDVATGEQRKSPSGDKRAEMTQTPEVHTGTPEVRSTSPEVLDTNTGSQLPPTSSLPLHEVNPHQSNLHAASITSGDAREGNEQTGEIDRDNHGLTFEQERQRQMTELQKRMAAERKAS